MALAELHKFLSDLRETHFVEPCRQLVIETLFTLADEEMKMLSGNTNQAMQMTLRVVSGLLNSIDMVFGFDKFLKVMKAVMLELRDVQGVIAREAIYMGYAIWLVSLSNNRNQSILLDIPNENNLKLVSIAEWRFLPNRSMKLEYLYYDPGEATVPLVNAFLSANGRTGAEAVTNQKGRVTGHINPAGLNYHFNRCAAPVVVKYRSELIFLPLCMSGPPAGCLKMKYFSLKWPQSRGPA